MTGEFINRGKLGNPVYITDVREAYEQLEEHKRHTVFCILQLFEDNKRRLFKICIPRLSDLDKEQEAFIKTYIWAEIYNILSSLGGSRMTIFVEDEQYRLKRIAEELNEVFDINKSRSERKGYGRCINVIDRMLDSLNSFNDKEILPCFRFIVRDICEMTDVSYDTKESKKSNVFGRASSNLEGKIICGIDVGGTDIKMAAAVDGRIACLKEYDWFPTNFKMISQLIDPICILIRLIRAKISFGNCSQLDIEAKKALSERIGKAMEKKADYDLICETVEYAESVLGDTIIGFDSIGLCFPDVVIRNKIVGGEVYKTRGIRDNKELDYETEFAKLTDLDDYLLDFCRPGGAVRIVNDGPMAAFTAAVELAASKKPEYARCGIFAHTLGTELGTGWVNSRGEIPEIPLEVYNLIIDLGSFIEKRYEPDDLRSINNFNTGLAGTLQKYTSQSGVFRLALKYFSGMRPDLYDQLFNRGFVIEKVVNGIRGLFVPVEPKDMRKPFLEYLMTLPELENDEVCCRIFREIGEFLAITWFETERILQPEATDRVIFGRLVKNSKCFQLMKEGAASRKQDIRFEAADGSIANTCIMRQLEADPCYTVAQFAQAVGAIYFGNLVL